MDKKKQIVNSDMLGAYPKRTQVTAFPERVFLKTNRFLVIITVINLAMIIAASCVFVYMAQRRQVIVKERSSNYIYSIDPLEKALKPLEGYHAKTKATNFAMEDYLRKFIQEWHSVPYESDKISKKLDPRTSLVAQMTTQNILKYYQNAQKNASIETSSKKSIRDVHIYDFHHVSGSLWSGYIETFDLPISDTDIATVCQCADNSKECLTCKIKNNNKRERYRVWIRGFFYKFPSNPDNPNSARKLLNPLGILVTDYNIGVVPIHVDPQNPLLEEEKFWGLPPALRPEL